MAKSIPVKANDSIIYHIELVHDFSMLPAFLQELGYGHCQKICIVTDSNVAPLYASVGIGHNADFLTVPVAKFLQKRREH